MSEPAAPKNTLSTAERIAELKKAREARAAKVEQREKAASFTLGSSTSSAGSSQPAVAAHPEPVPSSSISLPREQLQEARALVADIKQFLLLKEAENALRMFEGKGDGDGVSLSRNSANTSSAVEYQQLLAEKEEKAQLAADYSQVVDRLEKENHAMCEEMARLRRENELLKVRVNVSQIVEGPTARHPASSVTVESVPPAQPQQTKTVADENGSTAATKSPSKECSGGPDVCAESPKPQSHAPERKQHRPEETAFGLAPTPVQGRSQNTTGVSLTVADERREPGKDDWRTPQRPTPPPSATDSQLTESSIHTLPESKPGASFLSPPAGSPKLNWSANKRFHTPNTNRLKHLLRQY